MPDDRTKLGAFGEQFALGYLSRRSMRLVERNWRCQLGELDLIMRDGSTLVFVEVRTRRTSGAVESVGARKQARLVELAYHYLEEHAISEDVCWRIDVVAVHVGRNGNVMHVEYVPNAVGEV